MESPMAMLPGTRLRSDRASAMPILMAAKLHGTSAIVAQISSLWPLVEKKSVSSQMAARQRMYSMVKVAIPSTPNGRPLPDSARRENGINNALQAAVAKHVSNNRPSASLVPKKMATTPSSAVNARHSKSPRSRSVRAMTYSFRRRLP